MFDVLLPQLGPPPPSMPAAACKGADPNLFFPKRGDPTSQVAKAICAGCPELLVCRAWALDQPERSLLGIWGGMSGRDRRKALMRNRLEVMPAWEDNQVTSDRILGELDELEPDDDALDEIENGDTVSVRSCSGCGEPISGRASKWCSERCRRRARIVTAPTRAATAAAEHNGATLGPSSGLNGADGHQAAAAANGLAHLIGTLAAAARGYPDATITARAEGVRIAITADKRNL